MGTRRRKQNQTTLHLATFTSRYWKLIRQVHNIRQDCVSFRFLISFVVDLNLKDMFVELCQYLFLGFNKIWYTSRPKDLTLWYPFPRAYCIWHMVIPCISLFLSPHLFPPLKKKKKTTICIFNSCKSFLGHRYIGCLLLWRFWS